MDIALVQSLLKKKVGHFRTTAVDSNYTMPTVENLMIETLTNGSWTLTLPSTVTNGKRLFLLDVEGALGDTSPIRSLTIDGNGNTVGNNSSISWNVASDLLELVFYDGDWKINSSYGFYSEGSATFVNINKYHVEPLVEEASPSVWQILVEPDGLGGYEMMTEWAQNQV